MRRMAALRRAMGSRDASLSGSRQVGSVKGLLRCGSARDGMSRALERARCAAARPPESAPQGRRGCSIVWRGGGESSASFLHLQPPKPVFPHTFHR